MKKKGFIQQRGEWGEFHPVQNNRCWVYGFYHIHSPLGDTARVTFPRSILVLPLLSSGRQTPSCENERGKADFLLSRPLYHHNLHCACLFGCALQHICASVAPQCVQIRRNKTMWHWRVVTLSFICFGNRKAWVQTSTLVLFANRKLWIDPSTSQALFFSTATAPHCAVL